MVFEGLGECFFPPRGDRHVRVAEKCEDVAFAFLNEVLGGQGGRALVVKANLVAGEVFGYLVEEHYGMFLFLGFSDLFVVVGALTKSNDDSSVPAYFTASHDCQINYMVV